GVGVGLGFSNLFSLSVPASLGIGGDAGQQFIVAAVIFAILIGINIFTPKTGYRMVSALILVGIISLAVAIFTLLAAGSGGAATYLQFAKTNFAAQQNLSVVQV